MPADLATQAQGANENESVVVVRLPPLLVYVKLRMGLELVRAVCHFRNLFLSKASLHDR